MTEPLETLSRGSDYLGIIEATLRDLSGFGTLANELLQNADDAPGAVSMTFDLRDDALVIENDGEFRDCQRQDLPDCPWLVDPETDARCDFHSFRKVGSGDKRNREGTTGAFGIGFIAVYQVTDHPELISAGRHWIVRDELPEDERIGICRGCDRDANPGTRFILPWALDPQSLLRRRLHASVVTDATLDDVEREVIAALPTGMLFLKKLASIEVRRRGTLVRRVERVAVDDRILVDDGVDEREWVLVRGDFGAAAATIRASEPNKIERKRGSRVTIAVPIGLELNGLLAQGLPTQQTTGLPFHINADFFPSSDRKKMIFESDFQGDWNRAAVGGAAIALARSLPVLRDALGPVGLWKVLNAVQAVAGTSARPPDAVFATFWNLLVPAIATAEIAYGADAHWHRLADVLRPQQEEETAAEAELAALGLSLLHADLRPYTFSLPLAAGLRTLAIGDLAARLRQCGLTGVVPGEDVPAALAAPVALERLWAAIEELLEPKRAAADARAAFRDCAIAPRIGGGLAAPELAQIGDAATATLFGGIAQVAFVDRDRIARAYPRLLALCRDYSPETAIGMLEQIPAAALESARRAGQFSPRDLLQWFAARQEEVLGDPALRHRLAALPIFPGGSGLAPLPDLVMVGDFDDPLGLTEFVDVEAVRGLKTFLTDLGVDALNLPTYVQRLPRLAHVLGESLGPAHRRQILRLLADRLGELRDDEATRLAAAALELADVGDAFVRPDEAYFDAEAVRDTLGTAARFVRLTPGHGDADRDLLEWLGTRASPRRADLLARVDSLCGEAPNDAAVAAIGRILGYVGRQAEAIGLWEGLSRLKTSRWLPAIGARDRWFAPSEVYAGFSASLFESQAYFLDVPVNPVQQGITDYLGWLGVQFNPTVKQVVDHLLLLVDEGSAVGKNIYQFLNTNAADPAIDELVDTACLKFGDVAYRANEVFWGEHGLAPYAHRLSVELRQYGAFLARLGVKELPDHEDALEVLAVLGADTGHRLLTPEQVDLAHACWRILERDLDAFLVGDATLAELRDRPSIPNGAPILERPEWLYFDDRPGLAAKFGAVLHAVVVSRVSGTSTAMKAAGVRDLGRVVELQVIEQTDPRTGVLVAERLAQRRDLIARVAEVHARSAEVANRGLLAEIEPIEVSELLVRYVVPLDGGRRRALSDVEPPSALYVPADRRLYYVASSGAVPWSAIARELAIALFPSLEPGGPASGFRDVLTAESHAAAAGVLDELSYPRLAGDGGPGVVEESLGELGAEETDGDGIPRTWPHVGEAADDTQDASEPGAYEPEPVAGEDAAGQQATDGQSGGEPPARPAEGAKRGRQKQSRLRTYVVPRGDEAGQRSEESADEATARRTEIEEAGIARVVAAEVRAGWVPEVMPPFNPGFDIRSTSLIGEVRLIEVKSTAVEWGALGVGVSHRQFQTSLEEGDHFWLYVVERADDDARFQIFRIYDPGRRVDQFMFDDGWRGAHEPYPGEE